jgi:hypothetical protein
MYGYHKLAPWASPGFWKGAVFFKKSGFSRSIQTFFTKGGRVVRLPRPPGPSDAHGPRYFQMPYFHIPHWHTPRTRLSLSIPPIPLATPIWVPAIFGSDATYTIHIPHIIPRTRLLSYYARLYSSLHLCHYAFEATQPDNLKSFHYT